MALNYSHRPIFPAHLSDDNLISPMRIVNGYIVEGVTEVNREAFGRQCSRSRDNDECFDFGRGEVDWSGSPEFASMDIIDRLPSDPFGMDISTTVTAITGWLEDLEVDYGGFGRRGMGGDGREDNSWFAGLHPIWNDAMRFHSFPGNVTFDEKPIVGSSAAQHAEERNIVDSFTRNGEGSSSDTSMIQTKEKTESVTCLSDGDGRNPHEALFFALGYLGVKDLLSVGRVCSSLHSAVHSDSLLWRRIHIDQPLNERITDDLLFQLCGKAQGSLQCLRLVECLKITDDGLRRVVESNAHLTKLCVPGCTKLSVDGIINTVKDANSRKGAQGIKTLRIGGLYGATYEHFEEVKSLLGSDKKVQERNCKPLFYNRLNIYLSCDDDRSLDIEICPMCHKPRLVYDCPAKDCQERNKNTRGCRACILCIGRCVDCGRCINENAYEENFYMEVQCSYCFKDPLESQIKRDEKSDISNGGRSPNFCHNN